MSSHNEWIILILSIYLFSLRTVKERATDSQNTKYKLSDISIPGCPGLRVASGCCWSLGEENNIDNIVSLPSAVRCPPGSSNCRDYECAGQETIGSLGAFDDDKRDHCALHQYSTRRLFMPPLTHAANWKVICDISSAHNLHLLPADILLKLSETLCKHLEVLTKNRMDRRENI